MPLIKGKPLKQQQYLKKLRDEQEVFYCELTNEIFEDYEEYCDRVISCNCMIWTCAITGKNELTYQEALDSEEKALKNIKDFAPELRTPVLYLASLTSATHFSELADNVFTFVRTRYFVGESVQACFSNDTWSYAQVVRIHLPTPDEVFSYCEQQGMQQPIGSRPYPPELYKYEVEEILDEEVDDDSDTPQFIQRMTLPGDKVRRSKGLYTKDKNRAYLKQFTEQRKSGKWRVKSAIMDKYGISTVAFQDFFVGEPPVFEKETRKSLIKEGLKNGHFKQQSISKFLNNSLTPDKNALVDKNKSEKKKYSSADQKKMKKYAATIEKVASNKEAEKEEERQRKLEQIRKEKQAKREEKEKLNEFAKEWQKKREDLECEDLKELPVPCPVDCRVPNHLFGEFVMILEFFTCFKEVLNVKDYFPYGLSFQIVERALVDEEIAGPLSDILQLLLSAIFVFQDDEDDEVNQRAASGDIRLNETRDLTAKEAMQAATSAARWSKTYHNVPMNKLHLDAITVTDVLRIHLLSSGGRAGDASFRWRVQERGGYMSTDDPGVELRQNEPHILKFLANHSVVQLPITDKLKILDCLMTQILTYASVRDILDERYDKCFNEKKDLKLEQALDIKKDRERMKLAREAKERGDPPISEEEKDKISKENTRRQNEYQRRFAELREAAMGYQVLPLGQDRAHRRFWVFTSLPGLFVEDDERWPGHCLPQPTRSHHVPVTEEDDTMNYIRKLYEVRRSGTGSDKENEGEGNQVVGTPKKKHLGEVNGVCHGSPSSDHKSPIKVEENRPLVCTANEETCSIHNPSIERTKWLFFYKEDEVEELIKNLNKRGYREGALREILNVDKERLLKNLSKCPIQKLNRFAPLISGGQVNKVMGTRSMKGYEEANLKYPADMPIDDILNRYIREIILDTEDKIFAGGLGSLKVPNRKEWRETISELDFDSQDKNLTWPSKMVAQYEKKKDDEDPPSRPSSPCSEHSHHESSEESVKTEQSAVVRDLATAVLQLARSVEPKYLQKPLLFEEKKSKLTVMERWELSLMQCTSLTQVYLHHASLDNSIQWNKSVLNAKCKICRRGKDDVNMLLCDKCDRGFHLYCLKPKLNSIPKGDWFCPECRPKEKSPRKKPRRRMFDEDFVELKDSDDEPLSIGSRRQSKRRRESDASWEEPRSKRTR